MVSLDSLVAGLFVSIRILAGYPVPERLPDVTFVPQAELSRLLCTGNCTVNGAFLPDRGVLISDKLDPISDPVARSVLLHELVHYQQELHRRFEDRPACERTILREREAYAVQNRYLARYSLPGATMMVPSEWLAACPSLLQSSSPP